LVPLEDQLVVVGDLPVVEMPEAVPLELDPIRALLAPLPVLRTQLTEAGSLTDAVA